jgi:hypothetical protein
MKTILNDPFALQVLLLAALVVIFMLLIVMYVLQRNRYCTGYIDGVNALLQESETQVVKSNGKFVLNMTSFLTGAKNLVNKITEADQNHMDYFNELVATNPYLNIYANQF